MVDLVRYFDNGGEGFEQRGVSNGGRWWYASDLMAMLGYESMGSFQKAINKAIGTCSTLNISVTENFAQREGGAPGDYKLSRFACYLVAMNGDVKKPQVALAQAYFATLADAARRFIQSAQDVERVQIRDEVSQQEKSLAGTAMRSGVTKYAFFQNEGYRGMYNMDLARLKRYKGFEGSGTLLDFMNKRELAGNLFRLAETEERLKRENVRGQRPAENVAYAVGRKVRDMMIENSGGQTPEMIPLGGDIKNVRKGLKEASKEFKKLDEPQAD
ncbi:MAG: BRO family protein [Candidatus Polarisedimenticolia bacterium]